jgi:RNA polymerase sigma-70 factor (ECF subfamily)
MPVPSKAPTALDPETIEPLRAALVRFLMRRTKDPVLAEDLAQESLLHVLRGLPQFRGGAALRTWARRIAANVWRDYVRRRAANPLERAAGGDEFSVAALLDALRPDAAVASPEDAPDRQVTHNCLLDAVRRLPLDGRRIVLLHDFGEMPLDEVAAALGCSTGAAKVRLHRARRRLQETCRAECIADVGPEGTLLCAPKTAPLDLANQAPAKRPARKGRT